MLCLVATLVQAAWLFFGQVIMAFGDENMSKVNQETSQIAILLNCLILSFKIFVLHMMR